MDKVLPIDKLLDIKDGQYKVAVAAFKRVRQIAGNDRLRGLIKDSKRLPVIALANVLNEEVTIVERTEEEMKLLAEKSSKVANRRINNHPDKEQHEEQHSKNHEDIKELEIETSEEID